MLIICFIITALLPYLLCGINSAIIVTKIKSGDVFLVAEGVRSLTLRDMQKGLAAGERKMLDQARKILVSEFMVAKDIDEQQAKDMINECFPKEN